MNMRFSDELCIIRKISKIKKRMLEKSIDFSASRGEATKSLR